MRLQDLEAKFIKLTGDDSHIECPPWEADGIRFLCPKCYAIDNSPIGTHSVICWFFWVPPHISPGPGRWTPDGENGIHDLTFVPGSPPKACSVLLLGGCGWHGFVKGGDAS